MKKSRAQLRADLAKLDVKRSRLLKEMHKESGVIGARVALWKLLSEYLTDQGGSCTLSALVEGMIEAGHDLGKFPRRTVKSSIASPHMRAVFAVTEVVRKGIRIETVTLRVPAKVHYRPSKVVQQTGRSAPTLLK